MLPDFIDIFSIFDHQFVSNETEISSIVSPVNTSFLKQRIFAAFVLSHNQRFILFLNIYLQ
jgi:hypothetical protein